MGFLDKLFKRYPVNSELKIINEEKDNTIKDVPFQNSIKESVNSNVMCMSEEEKKRLIEKLAKNKAFGLSEGDLSNLDELFEDAARLVVIQQMGSTSLIQRKFSIGYTRSGRIMDQLEAAGIVGPFEGSKARQVLFVDEVSLEQWLKSISEGSVSIPLNLQLFYEENKDAIECKIVEYKILEKEEKDKLDKEYIKQRILEKERKKRIEREALKELIDEGHIKNDFLNNEGKREVIPQDVMDKVWNRDGGKCVKCGSQENLEFDHIIPFSKGGATSYRNIQLMCKRCNLEKSNKIG